LQTYRPAKAQVRGTVAPPNGMQQLIEGLRDYLQSKGVQFAFASGYGADRVPQGFEDYPVLQKPFRLQELQRCLASLLR